MTAATEMTETMDIVLIDKDVKARAAAVAAEAGVSLDTFIRDAILDKLDEAEEDAAFAQLAEERWQEVQDTGLTVAWDEARGWLEARARGENPPRPTGRRLAR
ncbi:hypothetical protein [Acidisoma silvae]|uniref:CopG family transcriptional regulator n=1 Tax=Acidisoma silvae TaxID=2802396 RepID=A0A963YQ04_9PROT|nr:hypothetical protein [Acidisoma silvae]MCB8874479.1 hypothetical protein [Acidisoma silvae]